MILAAAASDPRAIPSLEALGGLALLVTAPDKPKGRGLRTEPSALAAWALARDIPVAQPGDINACPELSRLDLDALIVIAYGQKLGPALLAAPRHGCLNLHPSLLPKYRGAAPIPRALLAGDGESGACVIRMVDRMDAGPILACLKEPIRPDDTAGSLGERLFALGPRLFREVLGKLEAGTLKELTQDEAKATRASRLRKEEGAIDWSRPATGIERQVRGLQPWPGAYAFLKMPALLRLTVRRAKVLEGKGPPGFILGAPLVVACGKDALALEEVQAEGRQRMPAADFVRGIRLWPGAAFVPLP